MTAISKAKPDVILDGIKAYAESIKHFLQSGYEVCPTCKDMVTSRAMDK